jgi:hypothetical protein
MQQLEAKDAVAIIVLIALFILVGLSKLTWEVAGPIITAILFYYLGIKTGMRMQKHE